MSKKITHAPKACIVCGTMFKKSVHESGVRFQAKKCCGHVCAATMRPPGKRKPFDEALKACLACGEVMQPHTDEPGRRYRERKTCNKVCGYNLQRRKPGDTGRRSEQAQPVVCRTSGLI